MFEVNKKYHGFKLVEERNIDEIRSKGRLFIHEKTKARLLHLENDDDNKVFSIAFRTPPKNHTGVAHILEHCVLAGSRKYTTKEPFMDMVNFSLRTFINAMTFPDKTVYPVASRNHKDFFNLMDLYLDAVFFPKIYDVPEIFMQEGWHHELFNKEEDIIYRGVVYNEMKGAYSNPSAIFSDVIAKSLLPDTCYSYSSGGNPDFIPELSYEEFLDFHRKLYHPSNSYIYLYGDGDLDKQLKHINDNYLNNFDELKVDSTIQRQKPLNKRVEEVGYYSVSKDDSLERKTYMALNFFTGDVSDIETSLINNILLNVLITTEAAPLKNALLKAGFGDDVFSITEGARDGITGVGIRNSDASMKDEFEKLIYSTLKEMVSKGIDKELLKAAINSVEFDLRESSGFASKGIIYKLIAMDGWLHDKNPLEYLQYNSVLESIKEKQDTDFFEKYIEEKFINNKTTSLVVVSPVAGLAEEKEKQLKEQLGKHKETLSEKEIEELIKANEKLKAYQETPDTEEDKASIPQLSKEDIKEEAEVIPQVVYKKDGYTLLHQNIFSSNITYLDLYFDSAHIEVEDLPYLSILTRLLTRLDTKKRSYSDLSNAILASTGDIAIRANVLTKDDEEFSVLPVIQVSARALTTSAKEMLELISEIIFDTKVEDVNRIKEIMLQTKSRLESSIPRQGNTFASSRVSSYFSKSVKYSENLRGLEYFWFLSDLLKDFDEKQTEILEKLNSLYSKIFNLNNLVISVTGDEEDFKAVEKNLNLVVDRLENKVYPAAKLDFTYDKLNEGVLANYNVQYVAKAANFRKLGYDYHGSFRVVEKILNGSYLHNRVRAQGGAYGVSTSLGFNGDLTVFSYRDPNLKETFNVYDEIGKYLESLELSDTEFFQYIIGTFASLDPARSPKGKGDIQALRYITGITQESVQKTRSEVLNTTLEDVRKVAKLYNDAMKENYICVLGNENKIKENEELFTNLVKLVK